MIDFLQACGIIKCREREKEKEKESIISGL